MISAFGNVSRKPATAGKVWTISPREPKRTTRKRGSAMRRLANGFEQLPRGMVLGVSYDGHPNAKPGGDGTLRHGFERVVGPFCMNIGAQFLQQSFDIGFGKEHDVVHGTKRGNKLRAGIFVKARAARSFE